MFAPVGGVFVVSSRFLLGVVCSEKGCPRDMSFFSGSTDGVSQEYDDNLCDGVLELFL